MTVEPLVHPRAQSFRNALRNDSAGLLTQTLGAQAARSRPDFEVLYGAGQIARQDGIAGVESVVADWLRMSVSPRRWDVGACFLMGTGSRRFNRTSLWWRCWFGNWDNSMAATRAGTRCCGRSARPLPLPRTVPPPTGSVLRSARQWRGPVLAAFRPVRPRPSTPFWEARSTVRGTPPTAARRRRR